MVRANFGAAGALRATCCNSCKTDAWEDVRVITLPRFKAAAADGCTLHRGAGGKDCAAARPRISLRGETLCLGRRVGERKDDGRVVECRHGLHHLLGHRSGCRVVQVHVHCAGSIFESQRNKKQALYGRQTPTPQKLSRRLLDFQADKNCFSSSLKRSPSALAASNEADSA